MRSKSNTAPKRRRGTALLEAAVLLALVVGVGWLFRQGHQRYMRAAYPLRYVQEVEQNAAEWGIAPSLVYAVIRTESQFDPEAVSHKDAHGLMQLTTPTLEWAQSRHPIKEELAQEDLLDPAVNIRYGVYVLKLLGEQFDQTETVVAAYNAGQGKVRDWLDNPAYSSDGHTLNESPYPETERYVAEVMDTQKIYQELYGIA